MSGDRENLVAGRGDAYVSLAVLIGKTHHCRVESVTID
jgi:hypothetical protein